MKLSIIIPTYNRADMISDTLESLVRQDFPKDDYEILVVDNASTDNTKTIVEDWQRKTGGLVKYLFEPRHGSHYARNGAVKSAQGDILYFTDDDVIASTDTLRELIKPFEIDTNVVSATGPVVANWLIAPPLLGSSQMQQLPIIT
ncbi:MAG: glycosyltransferase family 2 protein [Paludibacteraceae bacterium]|nr:glycosyltransferase family 2 protein [Paludibacteraceae bacterium]